MLTIKSQKKQKVTAVEQTHVLAVKSLKKCDDGEANTFLSAWNSKLHFGPDGTNPSNGFLMTTVSASVTSTLMPSWTMDWTVATYIGMNNKYRRVSIAYEYESKTGCCVGIA